MVKLFQCGHRRTVQSFKDSTVTRYPIDCPSCVSARAVEVTMPKFERIELGGKFISLLIRASNQGAKDG